MKGTILFISQYGTGDSFAGNRARIGNLLKVIRGLGWRIDLADVMMPDDELQATLPNIDNHVHRFCRTPDNTSIQEKFTQRIQRWRNRVIPRPEAERSIDQWFLDRWEREARRLQRIHKYKVVLVEYVFHSRFLKAFGPDCLKLVDTHDKFANRNADLKKQGATGRWFETTEDGERLGLMRADRVIAIQDIEKCYFESLLGGKRQVITVGHFCDVTPVQLPENIRTIGILASENPLNIDGLRWFLAHVWPLLLMKIPDAQLVVGGSICKEQWDAENLQMIGPVDHVADFYSRCAITINPMLAGTGLKIKTIESMAHGRPIIGTPVAFSGLDLPEVVSDWSVQSPSDFASAIALILNSKENITVNSHAAADYARSLNRQWMNTLRWSLEAKPC